MAESFGVEDRGHFYDRVGALQDVVVNHLMQVVAMAAMEAPAGADAGTLKDAKFAVFRSMPDADPRHYVRGQYDGYLEIDGVAAGSTTETYAALRLEIDNWRWTGVPFFIRTGKRLPVTQTELRLVFRRPLRLGFMSSTGRPPADGQLVVKLDPTTGVRLQIDAHRADKRGPQLITLDMEFAEEGPRQTADRARARPDLHAMTPSGSPATTGHPHWWRKRLGVARGFEPELAADRQIVVQRLAQVAHD